MPGLETAFSEMAADRKLSPEELVRAIRFLVFMLAAECEAVQVYVRLAESIDNEPAARVLREIVDEERVHARELLRLLEKLAPDEEKFCQGDARGSRRVHRRKPKRQA
jgi:rubrerythrin